MKTHPPERPNAQPPAQLSLAERLGRQIPAFLAVAERQAEEARQLAFLIKGLKAMSEEEIYRPGEQEEADCAESRADADAEVASAEATPETTTPEAIRIRYTNAEAREAFGPARIAEGQYKVKAALLRLVRGLEEAREACGELEVPIEVLFPPSDAYGRGPAGEWSELHHLRNDFVFWGEAITRALGAIYDSGPSGFLKEHGLPSDDEDGGDA